jgi:hypothetical protein
MAQEDPNKIGIDVGEEKPVRLFPHFASREHDQKTQRIPIALLSDSRNCNRTAT